MEIFEIFQPSSGTYARNLSSPDVHLDDLLNGGLDSL